MIPNILNSSDQKFYKFVEKTSNEELKKTLNGLAEKMGDQAFGQLVAQEVVKRTKPQHVIPMIYKRYQPIVKDGIEFFLSQVARHRLIEVVVNQLRLDPETSIQERLLELAKRFPTLHKLGQIIARNQNIDPVAKKWLVRLENGSYGTPAIGVLEIIDRNLKKTNSYEQVNVHPFLLSEASVAAVVPFDLSQTDPGKHYEGVLKVLKPGIKCHLNEELNILERTASFFERNRNRYEFKDFKFLDVFQEIRQRMVNEIDLAAEQSHLADVDRFYRDMEFIQIPQVLPFSTDSMTAMSYLEGPKITDAFKTKEERNHCAALLFEALICEPLFSRFETSLFHGDPHAGNIIAINGSNSKRFRIGLLDWSLMGRLAKSDRIITIRLLQAVFKSDLSSIRRAVKALDISASTYHSFRSRKVRKLILQIIRSRDFIHQPLFKRTFILLEQLADEGFVFSADLMLFRKAIFTLDGVIKDLMPAFDMDAAASQYVMKLLVGEIPKRFSGLFFPLTDKAENYQTLLSNMDLQSLIMQQYFSNIKNASNLYFGYVDGWSRLLGGDYWSMVSPGADSDELKN